MAHPGGRPTLYKKEYCDLILDVMGKQGKSFTRFCSDLNIHIDTGYEWAKVHPEFSEAFRIAKQKCEAVWEGKIEDFMHSKECNAPLVKFYMANRFKWSDKTENKTEITITNQEDALKELK